MDKIITKKNKRDLQYITKISIDTIKLMIRYIYPMSPMKS